MSAANSMTSLTYDLDSLDSSKMADGGSQMISELNAKINESIVIKDGLISLWHHARKAEGLQLRRRCARVRLSIDYGKVSSQPVLSRTLRSI